MKTCTKCEEEKPLEDFYKQKAGKYGVEAWCKLCKKAYAADRWANNKDEMYERNQKWVRKNRDKSSAYSRKWQSENREYCLQYWSEYSKVNSDKAASYAAKRRALLRDQTPDLTPEEQEQVENVYWMARDLELVSGQKYHVDHIVPLAKGGLHHPSNLQVLPADLNLQKGAKYGE